MLKRSIALIVLLIFVSSCATPTGTSHLSGNPCPSQAPSSASSFLQNQFTTSLMSFGGNLLATAASNYSQKYTGKLDKFLTKLVTPKWLRKRNRQQHEPDNNTQDQFPVDDNQGYSQDEQTYTGDGQDYSDQGDFEQGIDPYQDDQEQDGEGIDQGFDDEQYQYAQDTDYDSNVDQPVSRGIGRFSVGEPQDNPCDQQQVGTDGQSYEDEQNGYNPNQSDQNYNQDGTEYSQQEKNYEQQDEYESHGPAISLDVALVKKTTRNGTPVILPIKDGDLLRDGRGNPHAGDKFRIMFRPNSDAFVYVIAIDGSGWAQGIFPSPTTPFANPVKTNQQYVIPEQSNWFSLDQFQGIETIFFIASSEPRQDIEDLFKGIMGRERLASSTPQQVTKAPIIPNGYAKSQPSHSSFDVALSNGGQQEIIPTSFLAKTAGEDLRITRWFRHQ